MRVAPRAPGGVTHRAGRVGRPRAGGRHGGPGGVRRAAEAAQARARRPRQGSRARRQAARGEGGARQGRGGRGVVRGARAAPPCARECGPSPARACSRLLTPLSPRPDPTQLEAGRRPADGAALDAVGLALRQGNAAVGGMVRTWQASVDASKVRERGRPSARVAASARRRSRADDPVSPLCRALPRHPPAPPPSLRPLLRGKGGLPDDAAQGLAPRRRGVLPGAAVAGNQGARDGSSELGASHPQHRALADALADPRALQAELAAHAQATADMQTAHRALHADGAPGTSRPARRSSR